MLQILPQFYGSIGVGYKTILLKFGKTLIKMQSQI